MQSGPSRELFKDSADLPTVESFGHAAAFHAAHELEAERKRVDHRTGGHETASKCRIERIEVLPPTLRLKAGEARQFAVKAHFSDGHSEDVTRYAKYTATNQAVVNVDDLGKVTVVGHGESAVTAWFLQKITFATVEAPFENDVAPEAFTGAPRRNWIDDLVLEKLRELNIPPSVRCTDEGWEWLQSQAFGKGHTSVGKWADAAGRKAPKRKGNAELSDSRPL